MAGWLKHDVAPPQQWEVDMLLKNLPVHLRRGMERPIHNAQDMAEVVNLIMAYRLPADFLDGTDVEGKYREFHAGLLESEQDRQHWEAMNGPGHPQRWQRYTSMKYTRLR